ncbi:MAG: methyltransferase [Actinomycetaceae bacterium]|nr:methyltransferase [Actinomycetaceae bacterium]
MTKHYFTDAHAPTGEEIFSKEVSFRGRTHQVTLASQVFSAAGLDKGTAVLLDTAPTPVGPALDLGCGWGPLAVGLAAEIGAQNVWAVDVNERALALTAKNVPGAHVMTAANALTALEKQPFFRTIWSNPPIRVGKVALHELLNTWLPYLHDEGAAYLVVSKNLGADSLMRWLNDQNYKVTRHASKKGFRVLQVKKA